MFRFARSPVVAALVALTGLAPAATAQPVNPQEIVILTTTTTQDSGILAFSPTLSPRDPA